MEHLNQAIRCLVISGKIASGKTTLSNEIIQIAEKYNIVCYKLCFATRLKELVAELFHSSTNGRMKNREILVNMGQSMRDIDPNVWVNCLLRELEDKQKENPNALFIVEDGRFPNEIEALKAKGFYCLRLEIDEVEQLNRIQYTYSDIWKQHWKNRNDISETSLNCDMDYWDEIWTSENWPCVEEWMFRVFDIIHSCETKPNCSEPNCSEPNCSEPNCSEPNCSEFDVVSNNEQK